MCPGVLRTIVWLSIVLALPLSGCGRRVQIDVVVSGSAKEADVAVVLDGRREQSIQKLPYTRSYRTYVRGETKASARPNTPGNVKLELVVDGVVKRSELSSTAGQTVSYKYDLPKEDTESQTKFALGLFLLAAIAAIYLLKPRKEDHDDST